MRRPIKLHEHFAPGRDAVVWEPSWFRRKILRDHRIWEWDILGYRHKRAGLSEGGKFFGTGVNIVDCDDIKKARQLAEDFARGEVIRGVGVNLWVNMTKAQVLIDHLMNENERLRGELNLSREAELLMFTKLATRKADGDET